MSAVPWTSCTTPVADGQPIRVLTVVDVFSRECVVLVAQPTLRGAAVTEHLRLAGARRGLPAVIQCDNGTEFTSTALDHRAY